MARNSAAYSGAYAGAYVLSTCRSRSSGRALGSAHWRFAFRLLRWSAGLVRRETYDAARRATISYPARLLFKSARSRHDLSQSRRRVAMQVRHWVANEQHDRLPEKIS